MPGSTCGFMDVNRAGRRCRLANRAEIVIISPQNNKGYLALPERIAARRSSANPTAFANCIGGDVGLLNEDGYILPVRPAKTCLSVGRFRSFPLDRR